MNCEHIGRAAASSSAGAARRRRQMRMTASAADWSTGLVDQRAGEEQLRRRNCAELIGGDPWGEQLQRKDGEGLLPGDAREVPARDQDGELWCAGQNGAAELRASVR